MAYQRAYQGAGCSRTSTDPADNPGPLVVETGVVVENLVDKNGLPYCRVSLDPTLVATQQAEETIEGIEINPVLCARLAKIIIDKITNEDVGPLMLEAMAETVFANAFADLIPVNVTLQEVQ